VLNHESGLFALGGHADIRALDADGRKDARFAIYWVVRHAFSTIAAMKRLDAVAFAGGIGENGALIRDGIMRGLSWLGLSFYASANAAGMPCLHSFASAIEAFTVPAQKERSIAATALALLRASAAQSKL
jgi:acetate kinase